MKPIVQLQSGGYDSVLLLHDLRDSYPKEDIYTLFFNYGQNKVKRERICAKKVSLKLNALFYEIEIPPIDWSKNSFYKGDEIDVSHRYLEMRNLIFLSYATSFAESVGANKIFAAFMKPSPMYSGYPDTTEEFVTMYDSLISKTSGIRFYAPYLGFMKEDLIYRVMDYGITEKDFQTCDIDNAESKKSGCCGECGDCKVIKKIFENINKMS